MNGSGYPRNLKGDEIFIEARILAVADVVEAMASHRPYRPSLGIDSALEEIENNKGILYEEAVADACLKLFREKGYILPCHISNHPSTKNVDLSPKFYIIFLLSLFKGFFSKVIHVCSFPKIVFPLVISCRSGSSECILDDMVTL